MVVKRPPVASSARHTAVAPAPASASAPALAAAPTGPTSSSNTPAPPAAPATPEIEVAETSNAEPAVTAVAMQQKKKRGPKPRRWKEKEVVIKQEKDDEGADDMSQESVERAEREERRKRVRQRRSLHGNNVGKEPQERNYSNRDEYLAAWTRWRQLRDSNNQSVRMSRERKRLQSVTATQGATTDPAGPATVPEPSAGCGNCVGLAVQIGELTEHTELLVKALRSPAMLTVAERIAIAVLQSGTLGTPPPPSPETRRAAAAVAASHDGPPFFDESARSGGGAVGTRAAGVVHTAMPLSYNGFPMSSSYPMMGTSMGSVGSSAAANEGMSAQNHLQQSPFQQQLYSSDATANPGPEGASLYPPFWPRFHPMHGQPPFPPQ
eukprot:m.195619 g.195619  ORF g.195619 m.195619 type:complete len:380 (-) comp15460_c1_seq1:41-1180(-)